MPGTTHSVKKLVLKETPPDTRFTDRKVRSKGDSMSEGSYADALAAAERANAELESQLLVERETRLRAEARVTELEMELRLGTRDASRGESLEVQMVAYKQQVEAWKSTAATNAMRQQEQIVDQAAALQELEVRHPDALNTVSNERE